MNQGMKIDGKLIVISYVVMRTTKTEYEVLQGARETAKKVNLWKENNTVILRRVATTSPHDVTAFLGEVYKQHLISDLAGLLLT